MFLFAWFNRILIIFFLCISFLFAAMAGNIIPAIATTNAITAGIVVMRTLKVLQEQYDRCQSVYVRLRVNPRNQIFVPDRSKYKYIWIWWMNGQFIEYL